MTVCIIDKHNGMVVQKLTSPNRQKVFGYLTLPDGYDGSDISKVRKFATLSEARNAIGFPAASGKVTPPKSSYPQNQKGYKATSHHKVKRAA